MTLQVGQFGKGLPRVDARHLIDGRRAAEKGHLDDTPGEQRWHARSSAASPVHGGHLNHNCLLVGRYAILLYYPETLRGATAL
jgi:hypothetical protein